MSNFFELFLQFWVMVSRGARTPSLQNFFYPPLPIGERGYGRVRVKKFFGGRGYEPPGDPLKCWSHSPSPFTITQFCTLISIILLTANNIKICKFLNHFYIIFYFQCQKYFHSLIRNNSFYNFNI